MRWEEQFMEGKIIPLATHDIKNAGGVLGQAFQSDPVMLMIFAESRNQERVQHLTNFFANNLFTCFRKGSPLVVKDGGRILAALSVYPPGAYPIPLTEQMKMLLKTVFKSNVIRRQTWSALYRAIRLMDEMLRIHPQDPHYYLEFIGVEPDFQGKGTGSMIVESIIQKADEKRVGCYLETAQPRNLPLYKRFGYKLIDEKVILGVPLWFMWRNPE